MPRHLGQQAKAGSFDHLKPGLQQRWNNPIQRSQRVRGLSRPRLPSRSMQPIAPYFYNTKYRKTRQCRRKSLGLSTTGVTSLVGEHGPQSADKVAAQQPPCTKIYEATNHTRFRSCRGSRLLLFQTKVPRSNDSTDPRGRPAHWPSARSRNPRNCSVSCFANATPFETTQDG